MKMLCNDWEKHSNFTHYSVSLTKSMSIQSNGFIAAGLNACSIEDGVNS